MLRDALAEGLLERYGEAEPALTAMIQGIVEGQGGSMAGLKFRLKTVDSLARKITDDARTEGISEYVASTLIKDTNRYTAIFDSSSLISSAKEVERSLTEQGWGLKETKNYFGSNGAYQGLHYNFERDGLYFELQFHTQQSFDIKIANHYDYEVNRNVSVSKELWELTDEWMKKNWRGFIPPDLFEMITNYP